MLRLRVSEANLKQLTSVRNRTEVVSRSVFFPDHLTLTINNPSLGFIRRFHLYYYPKLVGEFGEFGEKTRDLQVDLPEPQKLFENL